MTSDMKNTYLLTYLKWPVVQDCQRNVHSTQTTATRNSLKVIISFYFLNTLKFSNISKFNSLLIITCEIINP